MKEPTVKWKLQRKKGGNNVIISDNNKYSKPTNIEIKLFVAYFNIGGFAVY